MVEVDSPDRVERPGMTGTGTGSDHPVDSLDVGPTHVAAGSEGTVEEQAPDVEARAADVAAESDAGRGAGAAAPTVSTQGTSMGEQGVREQGSEKEEREREG